MGYIKDVAEVELEIIVSAGYLYLVFLFRTVLFWCCRLFFMFSYPRVLIINGEPFNAGSATGITLSNLFRGWPQDRIAQIFSARLEPDKSICQNNWQISNNDLFLIRQFQQIRREVATPSNSNRCDAVSMRNTGVAYIQGGLLRQLLIPWVDLLPYQFSAEFYDWLDSFGPDVIYSTLGNIRLVTAVGQISRRLGIPVVPHFMDDWISTYSVPGKSFATLPHRAIIARKTKNLLRNAPLGLGIGDAMAEEYSHRFGCRFDAFMNPVQIPHKSESKSVVSVPSQESTLRLIYVGGLHLSRFNNLRDIAGVIRELNDDGFNLELVIYAPSCDTELCRAMLSGNGVSLQGSISSEDVQEVLLGCDIAIHVESFSKRDTRYTRLSVSTKIPQYFAAGLPVLAYGPGDVASCRYIRDYGCGKVVGEKDIESLKNAICEFASDSELRAMMGRRAQEVACARHDIIKERARFRTVLAQAAGRDSDVGQDALLAMMK